MLHYRSQFKRTSNSRPMACQKFRENVMRLCFSLSTRISRSKINFEINVQAQLKRQTFTKHPACNNLMVYEATAVNPVNHTTRSFTQSVFGC